MAGQAEAGVAGVKRWGVEVEIEEVGDEEAGTDMLGIRNSMRLFTRSTNGLYWSNKCNPTTAEILDLARETHR